MRLIEGAGGGGGGSQRTPVISPDSLHSIAYFRILDLVSEGEIMGLVNGQQSIYFDGTPLANPDGSLNFQNVFVDSRTGTQAQDYIKGYSSVESAVAVGVELRSAAPWVQALTNLQLSAVSITLSVPALSQQNVSNGDVTGYTINYIIEVQTDSGAWVTAVSTAFTGKTTSNYQRTHRVDLPTATTGWQVRVTRTTANANSTTIADTTTIDSYTEIIDAKLRYPNSALVAVSGDASTFSNIPTRAYDLWGRIISVPSNYDPVARTYTGVWDGSFKPSWTNNPAWVFYDLVTHPRYGLGTLITAAQVDKWALYAIAQYCDQLVPDGLGGTEPRFTCNLFLQTAQDAYKVLSDLAALFRGLSYWANGVITVNADMPADPAYLYTAANVIDGKFTYQSSARKTRYTTALVTWNNPANMYQADVEYVQHDAGLLRYGIQPVQLTALGCTSRGQAQRAGQWVLNTAQLETETVTFSVGLDGLLAAPGQIIRVQDPARSGKRQAGRIHAATVTDITVDKAPDAVAVGDTLTCMLPTGVSETHAITAINGNVLSVATPGFSVAPNAEAAWVTESTALVAQQFRVVTVTEDKSNKDQISFTITAVQNVASKYGTIDTSAIIQPPPVSALPATIQAPVASVAVAENHVIVQGTAQTVATISWPAATGADTYKVEWRRDNGDWIDAGGTSGLSMDIPGVYTGSYVARVRAVSANGIVSLPTLSAATAIVGKTVPNSPPTLTATGGQLQIALSWAWPAGVNVEDTNYTEVWVSPTSTMTDGSSVGSVAYPGTSYTISGLLPQQTRYAWVRLVDKSGNIGVWSVPANAVSGTTTDLFQPLQTQIDTLNTDTGNLQTQVNSTVAQLGTVQGQVTDILASPAWSRTVTFAKGELVTESGKLYRSLIDNNLGNDPATATADWSYVGNYASLGEAVGANASNISTLQSTVTTQGNEISANTTSINSNTAAIGTKANVTALNTTNANVTANANAITAQGSDIALLGAHNIGKTAFVLSQSTVQVDSAGTTLGSYISSVTATTNGLQANINTEQTARVNGDTVNANAISSLTTTVNNNSSAITAEETARANGDATNAASIVSVSSRVSNVEKVGANMLPNPTGAIDTSGWTPEANSGTPPTLANYPNDSRGPYIRVNAYSGTGQAFVDSAVIPGIFANSTYSLSAEVGISGSVNVSLVLVCLDASGNVTGTPVAVTGTTGRIGGSVTTPANTTQAYFRFLYGAGAFNYGLWWRAKLEYGAQTPYTNDAGQQANASATQSLTTSVNNLTGKVDASYTLQLNANGYVSGIVAQNNGVVSNLTIVADNFDILPSTGTGLRTEFSAGNWRVYDANSVLRVRMGVW